MRVRIAALLVLFCGASAATAPAQSAGTARMLVMPFENVTRDARIVWIGEAASVLIADSLNASGARAITREERREAFERLQVPPAVSLTDATVIRIGQLVGASQIVIGTVQAEGDALVVRARSIALEAGRVQANVTERGTLPELYALFERIAQKLVPSGASTPPAQAPHPPVAAFENYIKGLLAETPATAINYLKTALTSDAGFDRARLALWDVYEDQGDHAHALEAVVPVRADSPWARRARFLAGLAQINLKRYDEAFTTFSALSDARPTGPALNNLGVVQMRRGSSPQSGVPTYYFNKAAQTDATESDYFFNLGYAYWMAHDTQAAIYWLRETVRRDPADGDAHYVLGTALAAAGNAAEANREKELARRLSSTYADWDKRPAADAVPKGLERIKTDVELPHARLDETLTTSGQRDQRELARFYLDRARRLYAEENDREAMADLNRALFLSPYDPDAHLLLGRIHLRNGRIREAIDALKISLWSSETAAAHAVLAEAYVEAKDTDSARTEARRALALDPQSADARRVLDRVH
ncbi:MAG TPA: tetratricopeptide repeat protein [Vicinamibacterales bacterium]|jgi:tetratricopeptide (TPR) repeat protein